METGKEISGSSFLQRDSLWKMSIMEILINVGLLSYSYLVTRDYFGSEVILKNFSGLQMLLMYSIVIVILPWYLGYVYVRFENAYSPAIVKLIRWVFYIMVLITVVFLMYVAVDICSYDKDGGIFENYFQMFAMFLTILGPLMSLGGLYTGNKALEREKNPEKYDPKTSSGDDEGIYGALFAIIASVGFLIYFAGLLGHQENQFLEFIYFFGIFVGACFGGVISLALILVLKRLLIKIYVYYKIAYFLEKTLPFVIITTMIIWNEIGMMGMKNLVAGLDGSSRYWTLILTLFVTGFIPFRIIMLFYPPVRLINFLVGLIVLIIYIFSIT